MSEIDSKYVDEAINYKKKTKKLGWIQWGAIAACFAVVLAMGISYLNSVIASRGGPSQKDPLRPLDVIEFNGAYYEIVDMENTKLLNTYNLPHEITADMVGIEVGKGSDIRDKQTDMLYQYVPYAKIAVTEANGDRRSQRAVYIISDENKYSFALFCNYTHFDTNTHQEASEMFAVYGVDSADDISIVKIGNKEVSNHAEIEIFFENIYNALSMGNDDYQKEVYGNMSETEQQKLSNELADSVLEVKLITVDGLVINNMRYFPTTNHVCWGLNYYKLTTPINLR